MAIWDTLGITPTNDVATIKSAYAEKAKFFHPEEHPEEFLTLQQAYKSALKMATRKHAPSSSSISVLDTSEKQSADKVFSVVTKQPSNHTTVPVARETPPLKITISPTTVTDSEEEHTLDLHTTESFCFDNIFADTQERFYKELQLIPQSPYLQNHFLCWHYFLNQKNYLPILNLAESQLYLLKVICKHSGWEKDILVFLENYVRPVFHDNPALAKKYEQLKEQPSTTKEPTAAQKELHTILLNRIPANLGKTITNVHQMAAYLDIYFKYPTLPSQIKKEKARAARPRKHKEETPSSSENIFIAIFVLIFVIFFSALLFPKLEEMGNYSKNDYDKYLYTQSQTSSDTKSCLELLKQDAPEKLQAVLNLAENQAAFMSDTSLTLCTEEELDDMALPEIYLNAIHKDTSNVYGYYTRQGAFTTFFSPDNMYAELSSSYKKSTLWGFYLMDFNNDGVDELCLRNEYGQFGCIAVDEDEKYGIAFNWHIDYAHTARSANICDGGTQNYILLKNGTVLQIKASGPDHATTLVLTLLSYDSTNYSDKHFKESVLYVMEIEINASAENPFSYRGSSSSDYNMTSISTEEMETWLNTYVLNHQIAETDWCYLTLP